MTITYQRVWIPAVLMLFKKRFPSFSFSENNNPHMDPCQRIVGFGRDLCGSSSPTLLLSLLFCDSVTLLSTLALSKISQLKNDKQPSECLCSQWGKAVNSSEHLWKMLRLCKINHVPVSVSGLTGASSVDIDHLGDLLCNKTYRHSAPSPLNYFY